MSETRGVGGNKTIPMMIARTARTSPSCKPSSRRALRFSTTQACSWSFVTSEVLYPESLDAAMNVCPKRHRQSIGHCDGGWFLQAASTS